MTIPSTGSARRPWLAALLGAALAAGSAHAQSAAGSANTLFVAHGVDAAGGETQSANFSLGTGVGQPLTGASLSSTSFQVVSGVTSIAPSVPTDAPLVLGSREGLGESAGGDAVSVFGFNFTAAGAGVNGVDFGSSAGTGTTTVSNTEIQVTTPAGVDANANPLAFTSLRVSNALGSHEVGDAFLYRPALTLTDAARLGEQIRIRQYSVPGSFAALLQGGSLPGLTVPFPPYAGALEIVISPSFLTGLLPLPQGQITLSSPVSTNPALAGVVLELQVLSFDDGTLGTGSFSNLLQITLQP